MARPCGLARAARSGDNRPQRTENRGPQWFLQADIFFNQVAHFVTNEHRVRRVRKLVPRNPDQWDRQRPQPILEIVERVPVAALVAQLVALFARSRKGTPARVRKHERRLAHRVQAGGAVVDRPIAHSAIGVPREIVDERQRLPLLADQTKRKVFSIYVPDLERYSGEPGTCVESAATGLPQVTVPAGVVGGRYPFGISLLGPMWSDRRLLELGAAYERVAPRRVAPVLRER
ncbi:MAG: hypothetical protein ABMA15_03440 [Vicinamibacterales bacterium]